MISRKAFRRWHKWLGLGFCFFVLAFALSGIVLNHRHFYGGVNVSRSWLPESYRFRNWNNGLMRGSLRIGSDSILVYGAGGIFLTDGKASAFSDFCEGMPESAEARAIRSVVQTRGGELFACSQFDAYIYKDRAWYRLAVGEGATRFSDVTVKGDSVVFVGRDALFVGIAPYKDFRCVQLQAPDHYNGDVSLFRTIWLFHSGEIFGIPGRVFIDVMGILVIFFCVSGIVLWLLPRMIRRNWQRVRAQRLMKWNFRWHDLLGRYALVPLLFLTVTGFALRPPLLIALVKITTPAIPFSSLDTPNPWKDKLRALRWDAKSRDWLLSTSDGFFSIKDLESKPTLEKGAPPVSVMGVNVLKDDGAGEWVIGSFSGLYKWNRTNGKAYDYMTKQPAPKEAGAPFGKLAVSGYSADFPDDIICTYYEGTDRMRQPVQLENLPMSAWQLALEVHTGRIFTLLGPLTLLYIFISGILLSIILWSGWRIRRRQG